MVFNSYMAGHKKNKMPTDESYDRRTGFRISRNYEWHTTKYVGFSWRELCLVG